MEKPDYYEVLGVPRDADTAVLKTAYRRLAMKYHPDRNAGNTESEEKFKTVREAYDVLSDSEKRQMYDRFGHSAFQQGGRGGGGGSGADFSNVFDDLFGDFFGGAAAGRRSGGNAAGRRVLSIRLSFEESLSGCKKELRLNEPAVCKECGGSGAAAGSGKSECAECRGSGYMRINRGIFTMQQTCGRCGGSGEIVRNPCAACGGEGSRRTARTVAIEIPAGIQDGEMMRLNLRGMVHQFHLRVQVAAHPFFERDGDDLHMSIPISMTVAALGGHVESPAPGGGRLKITVPPGTQSDAILRLRGHGAPNVRGRGNGDMLCHITVETPVNLTEAQKEMLREFENNLKRKHARHSPREKSWLEKAKEFFD